MCAVGARHDPQDSCHLVPLNHSHLYRLLHDTYVCRHHRMVHTWRLDLCV
jgi:hypothetical protein